MTHTIHCSDLNEAIDLAAAFAEGFARHHGAEFGVCVTNGSVTLDLKQEGDLQLLKRMLTEADVLVENFRPGKLEKLGLVPAELKQIRQFSGPHYMTLDRVGNPRNDMPGRALDRLQMELVASRVSSINECCY